MDNQNQLLKQRREKAQTLADAGVALFSNNFKNQPVKEILPVTIPDEVYRNGAVQELTYEVRLRLRAGKTRIAVSVHDELGGQESSLSVDIALGKDGTVTIESPLPEGSQRGKVSGETV